MAHILDQLCRLLKERWTPDELRQLLLRQPWGEEVAQEVDFTWEKAGSSLVEALWRTGHLQPEFVRQLSQSRPRLGYELERIAARLEQGPIEWSREPVLDAVAEEDLPDLPAAALSSEEDEALRLAQLRLQFSKRAPTARGSRARGAWILVGLLGLLALALGGRHLARLFGEAVVARSGIEEELFGE